jgi:NADH-quinone oxidoreductase subunit A
MFETYFPIALVIFLVTVIALVILFLSLFVGKRVITKEKKKAYECGIEPTGDARERFPIKFYLIALLFIIFDIEVVFLYPWAVVYKQLKLFGLIEMGIFIFILLIGYYYIIKKGALRWD